MPGLSQPTDFLLKYLRYQRSYNWDVLLPDIGITLGGLGEGLVGFGIGSLVQKINFGDYSITSSSKLQVGPYQQKFAGMLEAPDITMTFLKTMPDVVSMYFNAWKKLIINQSGLYKPKSLYQRNIYIRFLDSTSIAIGRYKLIGCFPTKFPTYSLDYRSSEITTVDITFEVDKIEYEAFG